MELTRQVNAALQTNTEIMATYRELMHLREDPTGAWKHLENNQQELAVVLGGTYAQNFVREVADLVVPTLAHGQCWYESMRRTLLMHNKAIYIAQKKSEGAHTAPGGAQTASERTQTTRLSDYQRGITTFLNAPQKPDFYGALRGGVTHDALMIFAWQQANSWAHEVNIFAETSTWANQPVYKAYLRDVIDQRTMPQLNVHRSDTSYMSTPIIDELHTLVEETTKFQQTSAQVFAIVIETARAQEALRASQTCALKGCLEGLRRTGFLQE